MSTCMEGSVLSFLKAEWKVSDTGSAHWASSLQKYCDFISKVSLTIGTKWAIFIEDIP
jgi:hypothetical protein